MSGYSEPNNMRFLKPKQLSFKNEENEFNFTLDGLAYLKRLKY